MRSDRISFFFVSVFSIRCMRMYMYVYKEMKIVGGKDDLFALKVHSFEVFTMATFMYLLKKSLFFHFISR